MSASVNCRQAARLLSAAYDRTLDEDEEHALGYHLGRCLMCRNFDAQLRFLRRATERFRGGAD